MLLAWWLNKIMSTCGTNVFCQKMEKYRQNYIKMEHFALQKR